MRLSDSQLQLTEHIPLSDSYLLHVTDRIVRMFELYTHQIDPNDAKFQTFIKQFLQKSESRKPEAIPYSELYKIIREGIREYIRQGEATHKRRQK